MQNQIDSSFFDALMDAAVDAIIIIDQGGSIQRFNRSAQQMFGYSQSEILAQNVSVLMPAEMRANHDGYLRKYLETGKASIIGKGRIEHGRRKSGEIFPMRLTVGESRWSGKVHFVGIIHDLSRQQATEERLRNLEQQLFHADRLLTLGELTAGIAHEINQPLTAIAAYADAARHMVEKTPDAFDPAIHTICERIGSQSRRAAEVVERLREMVRSGTSTKGMHDIVQIIDSTLLLFDHEMKRTGISIQVTKPSGLPLVYVDEIQIQQVLVNLIKNSLDSLTEADQPGGAVEVTVSRNEHDMSICVSDNGPGVPEQVLLRLFEPFYTSKPKGVGLGLSICKHIAAAHGGTLKHSPRKPHGASFTLELPLESIG